MIRFLNALRQKLLAENRVGRYFVDATGEIGRAAPCVNLEGFGWNSTQKTKP